MQTQKLENLKYAFLSEGRRQFLEKITFAQSSDIPPATYNTTEPGPILYDRLGFTH